MGILRLLLAIAVIIDHSRSLLGLQLIGGVVAVKTFYMISGFYMSLILNEKYKQQKGSYKLFLTNRFLRLYPIYWTVLILIIIGSLIAFVLSGQHDALGFQAYVDYFKHNQMNPLVIVFILLSTLFIFGQELFLFLGIHTDSGGLFFTKHFAQTSPGFYTFLLIPQAWTVGLELLFYVIAPLILRRGIKLILGLIVVSTCLRIVLSHFGFTGDPWTYRFFPFELTLFLMGNVAYRVYTHLKAIKIHSDLYKIIMRYCVVLVVALTIVYQWLPLPFKELWYLGIVFGLLPSIFMTSSKSKWDRFIGELSYPVYMSHVFLIVVLAHFISVQNGAFSLVVAIVAITLAIVLNKFLMEPIEKIRQNRVQLAAKAQYSSNQLDVE